MKNMKIFEITYYDWYNDESSNYIVSAKTLKEAKEKFLIGHVEDKKHVINIDEINIENPYLVV
jgi:hypothetical protein